MINNNNHNHNHSHQLQHHNYSFTLASPIANTSTASSNVTTNINIPPLIPASSSNATTATTSYPSSSLPALSYQPPPVFATAPPSFVTRTGNTFKKTPSNKNRRSIMRTAYFTPQYALGDNQNHVAKKHTCNFCKEENINYHTQQIANHLLSCPKASAEAKSMFCFYIYFI